MCQLLFHIKCTRSTKKEFFNWLKSLFFPKNWTSAASSSSVNVVEVDKSLPISETSISVPADSVNKHNVSEFISPMILAHDVEIKWTVKVALSHVSYKFYVIMKLLFLAMFSDNAIVKECIMSKDKVSYYIKYGIAPVFRDEMLLTCVKWPLHSVLFDGSYFTSFKIINWMCILEFRIEKNVKQILFIPHQNSWRVLMRRICYMYFSMLFRDWMEGKWLCSLRIKKKERKNKKLRSKRK